MAILSTLFSKQPELFLLKLAKIRENGILRTLFMKMAEVLLEKNAYGKIMT